METKKFCLTERQMPTQWYNIVADMPNKPLPPLHPATKQPVTKEQMSAIFAEELIDQEMSTERFIDIPEEVQEIYKIWRPTPLVRATGLEKALGTPAKIYFKNESVSPAGSHKPNTAVPQAYYNYKQGIRHLTTETGAGQWGAAIAFAAKHFGLDVQVFMVKVAAAISQASDSRSCAGTSSKAGISASWPSSRRAARNSRAARSSTISGMWPGSRRCCRCIRSGMISNRRTSMRAGCATTGRDRS